MPGSSFPWIWDRPARRAEGTGAGASPLRRSPAFRTNRCPDTERKFPELPGPGSDRDLCDRLVGSRNSTAPLKIRPIAATKNPTIHVRVNALSADLAQNRLGVDKAKIDHRHAGDDAALAARKCSISPGDCLIVDAMLINVAIAPGPNMIGIGSGTNATLPLHLPSAARSRRMAAD